MADEISVLIVDDSALMRNLIGKIVEVTAGLCVAEKAMNGVFALQKIPRVNPDVICLDLEMPEMNGIEFLKERKKQGIDIPVIILSSIAEKGAAITMEALSLGACDFVTKPSGSVSTDIHTVADQLTHLLIAYGGQYRRAKGRKIIAPPPEKTGNEKKPLFSTTFGLFGGPAVSEPAPPPQTVRKPGAVELITIGISTGGPDALRVVFSGLDAGLKQPIVVVQHMPAGFTLEFARSLDRICPLSVKEGEEGDIIKTGWAYIAPGNKHVEVERKTTGSILHLSDDPPVNGHRPSADVLFASAAMAFTNHVLGVIMTGMGRDGAQQLGTIYKEGGLTLGQDEKTAVVYGMPRVAYELGHVMEQVPLERMSKRICEVASAGHL
ncbi:MAG: chemotaxis response regulator protein-glutamate methylesterase [Treponema sp.]|nr:chemotaxis response regulator protein-glutamate methylesterase [Treponema sp.]